MKIRVILILIICLLCSNRLHAQDEHIHIATPDEQFSKGRTDTGYISALIKHALSIKATATDSAIYILKNTLAISKQTNYNDGIARSLNDLGLCYIAKEMYDQAIEVIKESIPYCQKATTYKMILVYAYSNLSVPYSMKSEYLTAIEYLYKALEVLDKEKIQDAETRASVYNNLTGQLLYVGENDQALYYANKSIFYASQMTNPDQKAKALSNIGGAYYQKEILDSVLPYYSQALALSKKANDPGLTKATLQNIGKLYVKKQQAKTAVQYFNEALKINDGSLSDNLLIYYDLGNVYYQIKNYKKAEEVLLAVEKIAINTGIKIKLTDAYLILSKVYVATGRYKQAYEQQKAYSDLYASMLNEKNTEQYYQAEVKYETAEKDKQIAEKQLLITSQESRLKEKNTLITSISIILVLIAIISVVLYSNTQHKRRVEQLQAIMEGEEKERKRIARDLHDGISQTISAAKINLVALENDIIFTSAEQKQKFEKVIRLVDDGFKEVRTISHNMMPKALLESGLALVLKQFIDTIDSTVIRINLYTKGFEEHFDSTIETILYRVIQECVSNAMKHAHATQMDISLIKDEDSISVTIEDNGIGFSLASVAGATGVGIKNIQSRINFLNGKFEIDSSPGNGTLVSIYIPYA